MLWSDWKQEQDRINHLLSLARTNLTDAKKVAEAGESSKMFSLELNGLIANVEELRLLIMKLPDHK